MKFQIANFKLQISNCNAIFHLNFGTLFLILLLLLTSYFFLFTSASAEKWRGVDESVVEKYAEEHGRAVRDPIINTDQGDLLLFVFLLAGVVGGFVGGYYWRTLTENRTQNPVPEAVQGNKEQRRKTKELRTKS